DGERDGCRQAGRGNQQKETQEGILHRIDTMRGNPPRVAPPRRISFGNPVEPAAAWSARGFADEFRSGNANRRRTCSACKWQRATAKASAASDGSGVSFIESRAR